MGEVFGVVLGIAGNLLNALGYVLQKMGWNSKPSGASIWHSKVWVVGFLTFALGSIVFAVALGSASASLLLPLGGLKLAAFAALAQWCLGEDISRRDIIGICLVIVGAVGAVMTGPHPQEDKTRDVDMWGHLVQTPFMLYAVASGVGGVLAVVAVSRLRAHFAANETSPSDVLDSPNAKALALLYALLTGLFSSYGTLCIKVLAEELGDGFAALSSVGFYVSVLAFVGTNAAMEYFKQTALALFPAMQVIPAAEVSLLVLGIVATGIFFNEFAAASAVSMAQFWGFVGVSAVGIYFLSATEAEKMQFTDAVGVAMRVHQAKNKFKALIRKPSQQAGGEHEVDNSTDALPDETRLGRTMSPPGGFQLGLLPIPLVACWQEDCPVHHGPAEDTQLMGQAKAHCEVNESASVAMSEVSDDDGDKLLEAFCEHPSPCSDRE